MMSGVHHVNCENVSGTPGYACPHYLSSGKVTEGSEVYSFGMVLVEGLKGCSFIEFLHERIYCNERVTINTQISKV